ncbi:MAG: ABC transporter permease [Erythrobacter sp.]
MGGMNVEETDILDVAVPARATPTFKQDFVDRLSKSETAHVRFSLGEAVVWDGATLALIKSLANTARDHSVSSDFERLPPQVQRVLALTRDAAKDLDEDTGEEGSGGRSDFFTRVGEKTVGFLGASQTTSSFLREVGGSLRRFFTGRAQYQKSDLIQFMRDTGPQAIPLVGLVNLLLGVILAFMGAIQLQQFGAQIFVADLVAIGLTREIAPMMTAIILAGRTGAAYAAQLGTMQVNEEIDAFKTFGFSPTDFLVLPRMLALAVMTPLLVLYADAIGMFGGFLVGVLLLDISGTEYLNETRSAIDMTDLMIGIFKASIFGMLVAIAGCMKGMQSGRNASAVGLAATSAVVTGIVSIIIATAFFAVLTNVLGL